MKRLALAVAGIVAAMPDILEALEDVGSQRLVSIASLSPRTRRYEMVDPRRSPPPYWR